MQNLFSMIQTIKLFSRIFGEKGSRIAAAMAR